MGEKAKLDYDKIISVEEVEAEIQKHKDLVCRKVKTRGQTKDAKKDATKAYNDELKVLDEEIDDAIATLDELNRHKKLILAGAGPKGKLQSV